MGLKTPSSVSASVSIPQTPSYSIPESSYLENKVLSIIFLLASYLNDPICKSHEFFRRLYTVEALNPEASLVNIWARKFFLSLGMVSCGFVGTFTTIPATGLRYLGSCLQKKPFLYFEGNLTKEKSLPSDNSFSVLTWNVCGPGGGYSISDGGVTPWPFRKDRISELILQQNKDVVCLYEVFDIQFALFLYESLREEYPYFYFNIGPANGFDEVVNTGFCAFTKFKPENPEFIPFPKEMLIGRTKNAKKGVFSFDIKSEETTFARVYSAHPQHSERCAFPTEEEKAARAASINLIIQQMEATNPAQNKLLILNGDLNFDEDYEQSSFSAHFRRDESILNVPTWGGDRFCKTLVGEQDHVSGPLIYDYCLLKRRLHEQPLPLATIASQVLDVHYNAAEYSEVALSDHCPVSSTITMPC